MDGGGGALLVPLHAHEFTPTVGAVVRGNARRAEREAAPWASPRVGAARAASDAIRGDLLDVVTIWARALDRRAAVVA